MIRCTSKGKIDQKRILKYKDKKSQSRKVTGFFYCSLNWYLKPDVLTSNIS